MARQRPNRLVVFLIVLTVGGLVVFGLVRRRGAGKSLKPPARGPANTLTAAPDGNGEPHPAPQAPPAHKPPPAPAAPKPGYEKPVDFPLTQAPPAADLAAKARAAYDRAVTLIGAGRLVEARGLLADALNSNALPAARADDARKRLIALADRTIFSPNVQPKDPCTFNYSFKPGDVLMKVERTLRLHVSERLIMRINGIADPTRIRAGQTVKMVRGPFHAVVTKSRFLMDVYLQEAGGNRMILVRRFAVGLGRNGSTPPGMWRVSLGRKMVHAPWTPPPSSNLPPRRILWGEPGYPLGRMGYWIGLEGIEGNPHTAADGFGIHGTNDPSSIGRAASMGCIRLADDDIELVYAMLYPKWSKVRVMK